jgi:hypothetical protein
VDRFKSREADLFWRQVAVAIVTAGIQTPDTIAKVADQCVEAWEDRRPPRQHPLNRRRVDEDENEDA